MNANEINLPYKSEKLRLQRTEINFSEYKYVRVTERYPPLISHVSGRKCIGTDLAHAQKCQR